ncbi:hypothetical protein ACJ73_08677 [Blastomyces percursus]|uniref:Uncharacterized protein n=1 Tax=Blastomyces percursus TaxID=1658174 RepID=A0A1J9PR51_9EURO|nr:hypothetical protein ACJ73_08677 [Blastomyces percursus]
MNDKEPYNNCVLCYLVISPASRPIHRYESPVELLKALRDALGHADRSGSCQRSGKRAKWGAARTRLARRRVVFLRAYMAVRPHTMKRSPSLNLETLPVINLFSSLRNGTLAPTRKLQQGNIEAGGFERILMKEFPPWFDWVKPLCRTIRPILFPYGEDGLIVGTPLDHRLYDPIIEAYDDTIALVETK